VHKIKRQYHRGYSLSWKQYASLWLKKLLTEDEELELNTLCLSYELCRRVCLIGCLARQSRVANPPDFPGFSGIFPDFWTFSRTPGNYPSFPESVIALNLSSACLRTLPFPSRGLLLLSSFHAIVAVDSYVPRSACTSSKHSTVLFTVLLSAVGDTAFVASQAPSLAWLAVVTSYFTV